MYFSLFRLFRLVVFVVAVFAVVHNSSNHFSWGSPSATFRLLYRYKHLLVSTLLDLRSTLHVPDLEAGDVDLGYRSILPDTCTRNG